MDSMTYFARMVSFDFKMFMKLTKCLTLHGSLHEMDCTTYFARAVSYDIKIFMKLMTGQHFSLVGERRRHDGQHWLQDKFNRRYLQVATS